MGCFIFIPNFTSFLWHTFSFSSSLLSSSIPFIWTNRFFSSVFKQSDSILALSSDDNHLSVAFALASKANSRVNWSNSSIISVWQSISFILVGRNSNNLRTSWKDSSNCSVTSFYVDLFICRSALYNFDFIITSCIISLWLFLITICIIYLLILY